MREILFRGKRIDNGEWVAGSPWIFSPPVKMAVIIYGMGLIGEDDDVTRYCASYEVIPESISEFTGLTDKNGKKIFEGDIVSTVDGNYLIVCNYYDGFHYEMTRKTVDGYTKIEPLSFYELEVIGNIHDNPELLEVTK